MPPAFLALFLLAAAQTNAPEPSPTVSTPAAKQAFRTAIGALLQADGTSAAEQLSKIPDGELSAKDAGFKACITARLAGRERSPSPGRTAFASEALAAYQAYWRRGVIDPAGRADAERDLVGKLATLLGRPSLADIDAVEPLLAERLTREGLHSLQGRTGKLRDLMIWSKETERVEEVPLPEGANPTRVVYLDGFLSRGWSTYLSCDRTGSGGWTKSDGLYVVTPAYESLTDENFRVNFLAHESQHYSDKRRFADLPGWRLEYRAKLVELVYAAETRDKVLQRFIDSQGDDPADPHSFANRKVVLALRTALGVDDLAGAPVAALQQAALAELLADSGRLKVQP